MFIKLNFSLSSQEDIIRFLKNVNSLLLNSLSQDTSAAAFENALYNFSNLVDENGLESGREVLSGLADECSSERRNNSCKKIIKLSVDYAGYTFDGMKNVICKDYQIFLAMAYAIMYKDLYITNESEIMTQLQSDILLQI